MEKIARENTRGFIKTEGRKGIISVVFTKLNGEERTMTLITCRPNKAEALYRPYLTVFDMDKKGFRNLNLRTLKTITTQGKKYQVV